MARELDEACYRSTDPQEGPSFTVVTRSSNSRRGRPKVHIDPAFLADTMTLRPNTGLAPVFGCTPRTVRRRLLEYGLAEPGRPVYITESQLDGTSTRVYNTIPHTPSAPTLTDAELDAAIGDILKIFPTFGQRMIAGRLKSSGHRVVRDRISASYLRVHGAPGVFGDRSIHRNRYKVAGANSLWHHDGQHGPCISSCSVFTSSPPLNRADSFQDCDALLHRRKITASHRHPGCEQQSVSDSFGPFSLRSRSSWGAEPLSWRSRHRERLGSTVDGGQSWRRQGIVYLGPVRDVLLKDDPSSEVFL